MDLRPAGINASSSEGTVFAQSLGARGVSTAELMADAMRRGADILRIDASNLGRLDELADVSAHVEQEVTRAIVERGASVLIPDSESTIDGWKGVGCIIDEGSSISYRISGGLNGGAITMPLTELGQRIDDLQSSGYKALIDAFKAISPDWFEDCNGVRIGTFGGTATLAGVFLFITASHLGVPVTLLAGLTIPLGLLGGVGAAIWLAVLVVSVFATMAAFAAIALPEVRDAALAVGLGAVSQLVIWLVVPRARDGVPPQGLVALEVVIGIGAAAAAFLASPWFVLPAVAALATAVSLERAQRSGPSGAAAESATAAPAEPGSARRSAMDELRAARPGMHRFFVASIAFFLVIAALFAFMATGEPLLLVMVALFLALAAGVRFAAFVWVRTTPESVRRQMERQRAGSA